MTSADELIIQKDALLEAMLPNVLFDGWSIAALKQGAAAIDLPESEIARLFPQGAEEARLWLDGWADRRMIDALPPEQLQGMRLHHRVAAAIKARLDLLLPYREAVRLAIGARVSPTGSVQAAQAAYRTVDAIWWHVGDKSTDFSFYTKRMMLGALYSAAVLYWLNDTSDVTADTHDFIDRRLADIIKLPSLKSSIDRTFRNFTAPLDRLRRAAARL